MTIFVFWNWCNIKACPLYENRLLTLVCVIPGVQNLKSEGETESGIPLPWCGYVATGGLFKIGVEMGVMSQVQVGTYTEFPPAAKVFGEWSGNITIVHMHLCISIKVIEVRSSNVNIAAFNILTKGYAKTSYEAIHAVLMSTYTSVSGKVSRCDISIGEFCLWFNPESIILMETLAIFSTDAITIGTVVAIACTGYGIKIILHMCITGNQVDEASIITELASI